MTASLAPTTSNTHATLRLRSYPLAALQSAMLVNHLRAPRSGVDIVQMVCTLPEAVNVNALRAAWEEVSTRHEVLRTSFQWEDSNEPLQHVQASALPVLTQLDWSELTASGRDEAMRTFLAADRALGFDLARAPLQRVTLMRTDDANWHMVWTFHHILMDGRSFPMVLREVFAVYEASLRGAAVAPVARRPFSDFVEWYTEQDFSKTEAFWRERMRGIPGATTLPAAFHEIGNQEKVGRGLHARMLNAESTAALEKLARANGLTMNNIVQGAWSLLLARHAGETDVVFGATRACRKGTIEQADDVIGLFINTVPVRVAVKPELPLVPWLHELREGWRALFEAEHTPLRLIQRWSDAGAQTPLFDTQIVFENLPLDVTLQNDGGAMASRGFHLYGGTNFALTGLVFGGRELSLELENARDVVDDATAVRLLDHLASIFEAMAEHSAATVGELVMLPARERELVVNTWNETVRAYPPNATLASLLADQASLTPKAVAVLDDKRSLTYAELDQCANELAKQLRTLGVHAGVLVGVCAERAVELVVALVAVVKAGGAYVPIDPEYPADRVMFMLSDANAPVLLAQKRTLQGLPPHSATVVLLDDVADARAVSGTDTDTDTDAALSPPLPDDSAYMIYTSGSTGRPKGARNAHRGIVNRLLWMQEMYQLTSQDVVLQKTPFSFDVSVWEFFWPLITGAKLVMAKPGGHKDSGYLADTITKQGVTVCHFVPSMLRAFLSDARSSGCASLRDVMASGEALPADLVAAFNNALPNAQLHNLYGPTECAVDVTFWPCPKSVAANSTIPIGRPVANTQVYVLDEHLHPTAIGVPGELYLAGVQVGQGYHNRPELTAERFVNDVMANGASAPGAKMYRTGDRARWRPDGTVEYLGRLDFQVKIRGFRIELGEIENALLANSLVHDAVVVAHSDAGDGSTTESKKLVAYVVSKDGTQATSALRTDLALKLPDHMMPAIFVWLPHMPLSSNGKVDRRALPAPEIERQTLSRAFVAPRTPEEVLLADIWKQTLKVQTVGVEDNFFELGGDSLLGVQILARAAAKGLRITLTQLLRSPTVAALARGAVAESQADAPGASALQHEVVGSIPLTPVQQWFFENQSDAPHHWNQAFLFSVPADVNASALSGAIEALTKQHDSLRLRFSKASGSWTQQLPADKTGAFGNLCTVVDLSETPVSARRAAIEATCSEVQSSLNIEQGPLLRAALIRLGDSEAGRVFLAVHHLAIDGVSWRILREDVESAYTKILLGQPAEAEAHATPFSAWSMALAELPARGAWRKDLAFWERTGTASTVQVPRNLRDHADSAQHSETFTVRLSPQETRDLFQRVPAAYNTQVNDVLLAALGEAFTPWLGAGELVVNVEGHGREDIVPGADVSRTTGWFTTIYPVRLPLRAAAPAERLKLTKELLRAIPNRGLSYGMLRYLDRAPTLAAQNAPEIVFNYLGQFDQTVQGSSLFAFAEEGTGSWYGVDTRRPHLLELNALVVNEALELRWSFSRVVHERATIARVGESYAHALRAIIAHCAQPGVRGFTPSDFPLVQLDQHSVDSLASRFPAIEDVCPLTPMQELFLGASGHSADTGFEQWRYRFSGSLNVQAFRAAWEAVVQRHGVLRAAFVSDGVPTALQVVSSRATLPFAQVDLRAYAESEQQQRLHQFLADDRAAGFVVDRAPLMRIALLQMANDAYEFVWSNHHLLLDRWSWPLILQEIERAYVALSQSAEPQLEDAPSYPAFLAWQQEQSQSVAQEFWTRHFSEFDAPPRLTMQYADATGDEGDEVTAGLSTGETQRLHAFARSQRMTANSVIEAAWALSLARRGNHADVSFGVAVAGRNANVPGIERLVGLTINNLPLRVRVEPAATIAAWLNAVHEAQAEQQQFAHVSLAAIQQWSNVPWRSRLFETLLVFQHDDAEERTASWLGAGIETALHHVPTRTAYPLSIMVAGRDALEFRLTYDARYFSANDTQVVAGLLRDAVLAIINHEHGTVSDALNALPQLAVVTRTTENFGAAFVAPRTATEAVLARIWSEVLGAERVGVNDDFFRLGGYSLVATQIVSRIRTTLKTDAPVRVLFQHPTVAGLATALAARDKKPGQLERIAQVVQRVQSMSLEELRNASAARAVTN